SHQIGRDAQLVELMGDVAEGRAGIEGQRLIRIHMQARQERREFVVSRRSGRSWKIAAGGAGERLRKRDRLSQRERQDLTGGALSFFFADQSLCDRVLLRI